MTPDTETLAPPVVGPPRAKRQPAKILRGYSRAFTPHGDTGKRYLLDKIPAGLWSAVRARAKREGVSLRALILQLLTAWVARPEGEP
jgi:hypothetical protein